MLRLPPYAKEVAQARREGLVPARHEVHVHVDHWAKPGGPWEVVVLPPGEPVEKFAWWFLGKLDVLLWWFSTASNGARLRAVARAVLDADPRGLIAVDRSPDAIHPVQFFKTVAGGVEVPL